MSYLVIILKKLRIKLKILQSIGKILTFSPMSPEVRVHKAALTRYKYNPAHVSENTLLDWNGKTDESGGNLKVTVQLIYPLLFSSFLLNPALLS